MKINAIRAARAIWLVPAAFLNPSGRYADMGAVKERYSFQKYTQDMQASEKDGSIGFANGRFEGKDGSIEILSCEIHADGIVVETRASTDESESFILDLTTWATKEMAFANTEDLSIRKIYASELNFSLSKPPAFFNPALDDFLEAANAVTGNEINGPSDFLGLELGTDSSRNKNQQRFTIAREIHTAIGSNRYYSFASTTTHQHIAILEKLDQLVT